MNGMLLRFLVIVGVLLCSMHLAEPASAHAVGDDNGLHLSASHDDRDTGEAPVKIAHSGHHHCPVAPDPSERAAQSAEPAVGALLYAAPASRLASRAPPPPLDPPLA